MREQETLLENIKREYDVSILDLQKQLEKKGEQVQSSEEEIARLLMLIKKQEEAHGQMLRSREEEIIKLKQGIGEKNEEL